MGCLNSNNNFSHWFGNIHLSGPCNRSCYFCIGQHMMELDKFNNLDTWPLVGLDYFVEKCREKNVKEVFLTGTNTDPLLYKHHGNLINYIRLNLNVPVGIRTNAVFKDFSIFSLYAKASVTICSLNTNTYRKMMGKGDPPDLDNLLKHLPKDYKINVVLGPENFDEIQSLIETFSAHNIPRVNLREPYGQPHVGNPLGGITPSHYVLGMPAYTINRTEVTYWDVHYCEVESVNLYANGRVSLDYPITRGHADTGKVLDQSNFPGGRIQKQWVNIKNAKSNY